MPLEENLVYASALVGSVLTTSVALTSLGALVRSRRRYMALEASLPAAARYADLAQRLSEAERAMERERQALAEAKATLASAAAAKSELETARAELVALSSERAEQERLRAELIADRGALERVRAELDQSQARLRELTADLGLATSEAEEALRRRRDEEERVRVLEGRIHHVRAEESQLRGQLGQVQAALSTRSAELADLERTITRTREDGENRAREAERRAREAQSQEANAQARASALQAQIHGLEAQRTALLDTIAALRAQEERLTEAVRAAEPDPELAEASLWQPAVTPHLQLRPGRADEDALLREVEEHLAHVGLVIPRRALYAFHTSLKVSEQSPLVVLAGISGTGKSELPRRYAEAMGLHFLPIAVQPRWDGQQDLLGFYNYLERRYRATELTRALLQFDPFFRVSGRGWNIPDGWAQRNNRSEEMLLVLMDEMNLARVEYYFSDFLSKLETRRGIDRRDPRAREKAEVLLEVGPRSDDASSMRLFVDDNVLFVGTMNEDESTQSLSDKVVDRANVLRFGRPARLRRRDPATTQFRQRGVPGLRREQWLSWRRQDDSLGPDLSERLDTEIGRLNEAMSNVGRPFAHRTHQAIRAYVANYPVQGAEGLHLALGDQLEQRILPKLRGLDMTEHGGALSEIEAVARSIDDGALLRSINEARRLNPHQFNWPGVDRSEPEGDE